MTVRYVTQVFENTDYNPTMVTEYVTVTDPVTLEQTVQEVQRPAPLTSQEIATAQSNINYQRASIVVDNLCALGLSTSLNLDSITMRLNGGSTLVEVNE